jgi:2-hydroxymuconate-semialdehyde hydrolase
MLAGQPASGRIIDVNGIATSVLEAGDGPPVVLLHGGIECGGAMWAPVIERLARDHRVVVPDVPGLGESAPVDRLDVDTFAGWFAGLLEQTRLRRPVLVAHSLLGSLAVRFAVNRGDLLGTLVAYGAPAIGPYRMPTRLRYVAVRFAIRPTPRNAERFDRFALLDLDASRAREPEWFEAFDAYTRARASVPHVKRAMRQLISAQTKPIPAADLARLSVPTVLLWGRHDRMVPLTVGQHAAARHRWPLHNIDGAAHAPHIERPESFLDTLATITTARPADTGRPSGE